MREVSFDRMQTIPVIDAGIRGPQGSNRIRLVFDTGCGLTQIDTGIIEYIGYSARDGEQAISISGAVGETQQGYSVRIAGLSFFGRRFRNVLVGAMDFEHLSKQKIDGLLGWDIIRQLRFELNGPKGQLTVYSKR
jgi:hypothetical protein